MTEQRLNVFDVNAIFKQMAGKAVAAAMTGNVSGNAGFSRTFFEKGYGYAFFCCFSKIPPSRYE